MSYYIQTTNDEDPLERIFIYTSFEWSSTGDEPRYFDLRHEALQMAEQLRQRLPPGWIATVIDTVSIVEPKEPYVGPRLTAWEKLLSDIFD